MVMKNKLFILK